MRLFLKNLIFTVLVPGTVAVLVPLRFIPDGAGLPAAWGPQQYAGLLLLVVGGAIYLRCVWDFGATGRGTPAPIDPPRVLVVRGPYRYVRNPMYVGVVLALLGWAGFFGSWAHAAYAAGMALAFHIFVVSYEEPRLRRQFGDSYERYCRAVGRWLPGPPYPDHGQEHGRKRTPSLPQGPLPPL